GSHRLLQCNQSFRLSLSFAKCNDHLLFSNSDTCDWGMCQDLEYQDLYNQDLSEQVRAIGLCRSKLEQSRIETARLEDTGLGQTQLGLQGLKNQEFLAMCDYSLQGVASRPAAVGDKLTTRNFGTGT